MRKGVEKVLIDEPSEKFFSENMKILPLSQAKIDGQGMDEEQEIVTPGQVLTQDLQFMRGHGTYIGNETLVASVAGRVERINKLISVKPLKTRFAIFG